MGRWVNKGLIVTGGSVQIGNGAVGPGASVTVDGPAGVDPGDDDPVGPDPADDDPTSDEAAGSTGSDRAQWDEPDEPDRSDRTAEPGRLDPPGEVDFFVSYVGGDQPWAEWIGWELERAGYRVLVRAWDLVPGRSRVQQLDQSVRRSARTLAVVSAAYLGSATSSVEWEPAWAADPTGASRSLIVVRVENCRPSGLLASLVGVDLFGLDAGAARRRLLAAAAGRRGKPATAPRFPGPDATDGPTFPGHDTNAQSG
jgi:hypothetical protein